MTGTFLAGKGGSVLVGNATWRLHEWSIDMPTDPLDVTNFSSGGYKENIAGLTSAKISAKGAYDSGAMALTSGTSYNFTLSAATNVNFAVTARVTTIKVDVAVDKAVSVDVSADSTGAFTAAIT